MSEKHPEPAYDLLRYWLDNYKPNDTPVNYALAFEQNLPEPLRVWVAYWEREGLLHRTPTLGLDRAQATMLLHLRQLTEPASSPVPAKKPGRRRNANDETIAAAYREGLESGEWVTQVEYLQKHHAPRYKQNAKAAKAWLCTLLKRADARRLEKPDRI
ncbi:MAG: hypothetical protein JNL18_17100 [Planctomycetaceae bacterium]|nr:hypothetical protein [Planctomycetaceae bacterium]